MAFDASPSWSGFNYQGKVALYYSLKTINGKPLGENYSNVNLMLENIEDFEIIEGGVVKTIHQVKAYNTESYSKYENALLEIALELYKNSHTKGFIHTWKEINFGKNKELKDALKSDLNELLEQYKIIPRTGKSFIEKATIEVDNRPKKSAILRNGLPGKNADEIKDIIEDICSEKNNVLDRLEYYKYENGDVCCGLEEINKKIKNEINTFLTRNRLETSDHQIQRTFLYLLGMIDRYIIGRHQGKQNANKISIGFEYIISLLKEDKEKISLNYLSFNFKENFLRKIDEYMTEEPDYEIPMEGTVCNLRFVRDFIFLLSPLDLWSYYRSFSPDTYLEHQSNLDNAIGIDEKGIRYVLIRIFHLLNHKKLCINHSLYKFTYSFSALPEDNYLPSVIGNYTTPENIAKEIIKNGGLNELRYEIGNIIYHGPRSFTFKVANTKRSDIPEEEGSESKNKRNDELNIVNLIPIENAKAILS